MILDRTMDAQSAFYYPALMMRYNAGDETLTDEDYHYLYYGYAYRDEYKPLAVNPDLDKMLMLASGIDPDKPDRATLETMVSVGNDALKRDPFSPKSSTSCRSPTVRWATRSRKKPGRTA